MKKKLVIVFSFLLMSMTFSISEHEKMSSIYTYSFIKYIEWPKPVVGDFKVGVIGSETSFREMQTNMNGKKKGSINISVQKITGATIPDDLHVIYVANENCSKLNQYISSCPANAMIVSQRLDNLSKTKSINIFLDEEENKLKFEINQNSLEKRGFKISSSLLTLAKIVQ